LLIVIEGADKSPFYRYRADTDAVLYLPYVHRRHSASRAFATRGPLFILGTADMEECKTGKSKILDLEICPRHEYCQVGSTVM
jgi:hypothetical protein